MNCILRFVLFLAGMAVFVCAPQEIFASPREEADSTATMHGIVSYEEGGVVSSGLNGAFIDVQNGGKYYNTITGKGAFTIKNLKPGPTALAVTYSGFYTHRDTLDIGPGMNLVYITLERTPEKIDSSVVKAEQQLVRKIGDTLRFNAAAVNVTPDDYAIAILEQLPGITISNGKITAFGSTVSRTYVNGMQVFGQDPLNAFNTIKADQVTSVDVYDELSTEDRRQGLKHGRKDKVMNIRTSDPIVNAYDIFLSAAGGMDMDKTSENLQGRYAGRASMNFFSEMFLAYLRGDMNNVNRDFRDGGSSAFDYPLRSYSEAGNIEAGIEKYWKDRALGNFLIADYSYGRNYSRNGNSSRTEYFATEFMPSTTDTDTTRSTSNNYIHSLNLNLVLPRTPLKMIKTDNHLSFSDTRSGQENISSSIIQGQNPLRQNEFHSTQSKLIDYAGNLTWVGIGWGKIAPEVSVDATVKSNEGNASITDTLETSYNKRILKGEGDSRTVAVRALAGAEYFVMNKQDESLRLNASYSFGINNSKSAMYYYDFYGYEEPQRNDFLTYDYTWHTVSHSAYLHLQYSFKNFNLLTGAQFKHETQKDRETLPGTYQRDYTFMSVLPEVKLSFLRNRLSLSYNTSSKSPALEQLRARIDDSNPLRLTGGNPDLRQTYVIESRINYSTLPSRKGNTFSLSLSYRTKLNDIVYKTTYFDSAATLDNYGGYSVLPGTMLTTYVNESGATDINGYMNYFWRIPKTRSTMQFRLMHSYIRTPFYDGEVFNPLQNNTSTAQVDLNWRKWKKVRLTLIASSSYINSVSQGGSTASIRTRIRPMLSVIFAKKMFANVNYEFTHQAFLNRNFEDNFEHLLFAELGCRLLGRKLTLSISGHDLIHKGSFYTFTTTSNYLRHSWDPSYGRYLLFNIKYRFTKTSGTPFMGELRR